MFLQTVTDFSGIDFVLHAVGVLESYSAVSPEKFVLDCEALRYLDRFREGFRLDDEAFALDAIASTDPGGHFVSDSNAGDEPAFFRSEFVDKRSHVDWANAGRKSALEQGRDRVRSRLDAYERPPMAVAVERELDRYVEAHTAGPE
jgi:trimethylamine--corrinoid protein Co-methyltransferase